MSSAWPPPRAVLLDLGYTLVRWEVSDAVRLASHGAILARLESVRPDGEPPADLFLRLERHVLAAARGAYEADRLTELDNHALFAAALLEHGYTVGQDQVRELVALEHAAFAQHLRVAAETRAALETLRARGLRLGLVSNTLTPGDLMRRTLEGLGILPYFDAIAISSELGMRKPHPAIYEGVLRALDVRPEQAVFVGDRVREDVIGPRAIGMRAILCHEYRQEPPSDAAPDAIIAAFAELPATLDRLQRAAHGPDAGILV